jgi:hypothetical protein
VNRTGQVRRPPAALLRLATLLILLGASGARAQIPYLDPIPWVVATAKVGQESFLVGLDRFWDSRTDWSANRLGVTGLLRAGRGGTFFLRTSYAAFDSGDLPLFTRWPAARGPEAAAAWPGEARSVGLGRPELGAVGQFHLSPLGAWWYAVGVGLPIGRDQMYPLSAASIPVRIDLRRSFRVATPLELACYGGPIWHFSSSGDALSDEAFPNGFHVAADLQWVMGERRSLTGGADFAAFHGRSSFRLRVRYWMPVGADDAFGVEAAWELGDREQRAFAGMLAIAWRFNRRAAEAAPTPPAPAPEPEPEPPEPESGAVRSDTVPRRTRNAPGG